MPNAPGGEHGAPTRTPCCRPGVVADGVGVAGSVVVGRTVVGLGLLVVGFTVATSLVLAAGLGVVGWADGLGSVGLGSVASALGSTSVGSAAGWADPLPRMAEAIRPKPPQQSTTRTISASRTTLGRRLAGAWTGSWTVGGNSHGSSGWFGVVIGTPCDKQQSWSMVRMSILRKNYRFGARCSRISSRSAAGQSAVVTVG